MIKYAVIPLGGLGTRLYPLTVETSKAMIRFLNRPLIEFIIYRLIQQGVKEIYLGVSGYINYRNIYDYLGEGYRLSAKYGLPASFRVRYQPLEDSVGNADSVRIVVEYYGLKNPLLVVQGDTVFDMDLLDLWNYHVGKESFMTIVLKDMENIEDIKDFGVALLDPDMRIRGFIEKPKRLEDAPSRSVNTGIYLLSEELVSLLSTPEILEMRKRGEMDFGKDIIPKLIRENRRVYGFKKIKYWFDVGTPKRLFEASLYLLRNLDPAELEVTDTWNGVKFQGSSARSKALHKEIISRAEEKKLIFEGDVLVGRHVYIGDYSRIRDSIIDNYTIVSEGSVIEGSIVMDRSYIGKGSHIVNSIIGRHVKIGENVFIEGSVIGDNVKIGNQSKLIKCKIWPHKEIDPEVVIENMAIK